jgi:hypothetical protein
MEKYQVKQLHTCTSTCLIFQAKTTIKKGGRAVIIPLVCWILVIIVRHGVSYMLGPSALSPSEALANFQNSVKRFIVIKFIYGRKGYSEECKMDKDKVQVLTVSSCHL